MSDPNTRSRTCAREEDIPPSPTRAGDDQTSGGRPATRDEEWAICCCLWPALRKIERVRDWEKVEALLVTTPLPTAVFDLAVDRLHDQRNPARFDAPKQGAFFPWQEAGFANRGEMLAELRRLGYTGRVGLPGPDLWAALCGLRTDLAG